MNTLADILAALPKLSVQDKKKLMQQVMMEVIKINPEEEIVVVDDDRQPIMYCVPPSLHHPWISPEFKAELDRRAQNRDQHMTLSEMLAKLEEMAKEKEKELAEADSASRIHA